MNKAEINLSKFISLILRHKPEVIGIKLDKNGWADVDELIKGILESGGSINFELLERIVYEDPKRRYSFSKDMTKIRANQGHSIKVDVGLKEKLPPKELYHGTSERAAQIIKRDGIKPMSRLYVHLSTDYETATKVGGRHGRPVIFKVNSALMHKDGVKFYISENGVWMTDYIEPKYLMEV